MQPNNEVNTIFDVAALFRDVEDDRELNFHCGTQCSADCLIHFIGRNRFQNICRRADIQCDADCVRPLSRREIKMLFLNLLNVQADDVEAHAIEASMPFHNHEELRALLLHEAPSMEHLYIDRAASSGKGIEGQVEKAYILGLHHLSIANGNLDDNEKMLCDSEMLASRLADREMQVGTIIHLNDGYFKVDRTFVGGGAYVSSLRDINDPSKLKIVCRGTATRSGATEGYRSGLNNLLIEIGSLAIKQIWQDLAQYLSDAQIESIELLGKSQGGAHAQMLALLIEGLTDKHVKTLTTVSSVGVSKSINQLFGSVLERRNSQMNIVVIRNGGCAETALDYVPSVGGAHLGSNNHDRVKVFYLHPRDDLTSHIYTATLPIFESIKMFLLSFRRPHLTQMTLRPFTYTLIEGVSVSTHLAMGKKLEKMRLFFAYILHIFTFGLLNKNSFESFFNEAASQRLALAS